MSRNESDQEKLKNAHKTSSKMVHDVRSSVLAIQMGATGLDKILPRLIEGYEYAIEHGCELQQINADNLTTLKEITNTIGKKTTDINTSINGFWESINNDTKSTQPDNQSVSSSNVQKHPIDNAVFKKITRLLIVDDDPVNQVIGKRILGNKGFHIDTADNCEEALELCEKYNYDIIILDIYMPNISGLEAAPLIREKITFSQPFIVGMSNDPRDEIHNNCINKGMNDYQRKPITPEWSNKLITKATYFINSRKG